MYPLEQLDATTFQQLASALAVRAVGPSVQTYGRGADGGRDMTFHGTIESEVATNPAGEAWVGYTVFQVKHRERLAARPADDATWLIGQIRSELDSWADDRVRPGQLPDYIIFVTNVPLSAVPNRGGVDRVNKAMRDIVYSPSRYRLRNIKGWQIWDRTKIETLLDSFGEVRKSFVGLLTAADVLDMLTTSQTLSSRLEASLRAHARKSLVTGQWIYFDEAGAGAGSRASIHSVVVDLPLRAGVVAAPKTAVRQVIEHGNAVLRRSAPRPVGPRHLVLAGAPGNGKTTITKFLAQVYRACFLDVAGLSGVQRELAEATLETLRRLEIKPPVNRRWVIHIDLAAYSDYSAARGGVTLLDWILIQVNKRNSAPNIADYHVAEWLVQWPWLLILDGLDEVTSIPVRRGLIEEIESLVAEADHLDADLLVLVTTRPTGFTENIAPGQFARMDLDELSLSQAEVYGDLVTDVRLSNDDDRKHLVKRRLAKARENENVSRLMRTPLQILIMSFILESSGTLPPDRYRLFWLYYETVVKREKAKPGESATLIANYEQHILAIHERLGLALHVEAESLGGATAALPMGELSRLMGEELQSQGFDVNGGDKNLVTQVLSLATHRLVLIVPRPDGGFGFDVRSLQELMAARRLTTGRDEHVLRRLESTAHSPHWRNSWLFAAGRLFAEGQSHRQRDVLDLLSSLDERAPWRLGRVCPIAPTLALELLHDGSAAHSPQWAMELLQVGLRLLQFPTPEQPELVAASLGQIAARGKREGVAISTALEAAQGGTMVARGTCRSLIPHLSPRPTRLFPDGESPRGRPVAETDTSRPMGFRAAWDQFRETAELLVSDRKDLEVPLSRAIDELEAIAGPERVARADDFLTALSIPELATALQAGLQQLMISRPTLIQQVRRDFLPDLLRAPVRGLGLDD